MELSVTLKGRYRAHHSGFASANWKQICTDHEEEFPQIRDCHPGTFNILITGEARYLPPNEHQYRHMAKARGLSVRRYVDSNHVSPCAKVIEINGNAVEAWLYRGGHGDQPTLELLSRKPLADTLCVQDGDELTVRIVEVTEATPGMPQPPPTEPGTDGARTLPHIRLDRALQFLLGDRLA